MGQSSTAIESDPKLAAPRNNLGSLYVAQGRIAEAEGDSVNRHRSALNLKDDYGEESWP